MIFENNYVEYSGTVSEEPAFSHHVGNIACYKFKLKSQRMSGVFDEIPVVVMADVFNVDRLEVGMKICVIGNFHSYRKHFDEKSHLMLHLFARSIDILNEEESLDQNYVYLDGFVCREPVYRTTSKGRLITELLIAVHRTKSSSDYIPVICWGVQATAMSEVPVGTKLKISGRLQSREYIKVLSETESETRIAYEVSAKTIELEAENE